MRKRLLAVPVRDAPEAQEDIFLAEGKVVETTVDRILVFGFCVVVSCEDFPLVSL